MKTITKTLSASLLTTTLLGGTAFAGGNAHWGYEGHGGPGHWGELSRKFHTCKEGKSQSPIDISSSKDGGKAPITLAYKASAKNIVNNGHTIQVNMNKGSSITVGGKTYALLQFHFHTPSEHTINGKPADMVAHLVHKSADGKLAVIGVLMNKGKENPAIAAFWRHMPKKADARRNLKVKYAAQDLLPRDLSYYNYSGSLTTPPCTEGVNWIVLKTPVEVSEAQIKQFSSLMHHNARPTQPLHGRVISTH